MENNFASKKIQITSCYNHEKGKKGFSKFTPNSFHQLLSSQFNGIDAKFVFWVQGDERPVILLKWEFRVVPMRNRFKKKSRRTK